MHVFDVLCGSEAALTKEPRTFEYRLLCSGQLYSADVQTIDWRKSDASRILLQSPCSLYVCSALMGDYPQEIALRFQTGFSTEQQGQVHTISYFDSEIAQDLSSLLSLLCRRLITVAAVIAETSTDPSRPQSSRPIGFLNSFRRVTWARQPASLITSSKRTEVIDYNPPPLPISAHYLQDAFKALCALPQRESFMHSARLYALGLQHIPFDVDIAYHFLIASVEAIAQAALGSYRPTEEEMLRTKESVAKLAVKFGLSDHNAKKLALEACKGIVWTKRKFAKFIIDNIDDTLWEQDDLFKLEPSFVPRKQDLASALDKVYAMRGQVAHGGYTYPATAQLGIGPTFPASALSELWSADRSAAATHIFPPIPWFEKAVNQSLRGFLLKGKAAADDAHVPAGDQGSRK